MGPRFCVGHVLQEFIASKQDAQKPVMTAGLLPASYLNNTILFRLSLQDLQI